MNPPDDSTAPRRLPEQQRSRERVERILTAATDLIAAHGSDGLKMSELAKQASVPIGSVYQYFPDKTAILRVLAERCYDSGSRCITGTLAAVTTPDGLTAAFGELVALYYAEFRASPSMTDILAGLQSDPWLQQMDIAYSRTNGALLAQTLSRVAPSAAPGGVEPACFLIMHLGEATLRLAATLPPAEGDPLVATYRRMAEGELVALMGGR